MLHRIVKWLKICIDLNIEISEVDHYTWTFTSKNFRLALEISKSKGGEVLIKAGERLKDFLKKITGRTLIRDSRVL